MEPAAMLVRSLEVEVGREAESRIAAQNGLVRRSRVEPHVERIGQLAVLCGIDAEVLVRGLEPRLDSSALDLRRGELEERRRVGMELIGLDIDEERQRNAPLPLPGEGLYV